MKSGDIYYAEQGSVYVLKFVGDILYTMGCSLDSLLEQHLTKDTIETVFVDLTEATSIDSTSLGLLAKIANSMRARGKEKAVLISPNEDINQVLESLGFDEVFYICDRDGSCPKASKHLDVVMPAKEKMTKTVLEAHSILSDINERNRAIFENVVVTLKGKLSNP